MFQSHQYSSTDLVQGGQERLKLTNVLGRRAYVDETLYMLFKSLEINKFFMSLVQVLFYTFYRAHLVLLCVNGHFGQWAAQLYKVVPVLHQ
jgi:hypothetical protein